MRNETRERLIRALTGLLVLLQPVVAYWDLFVGRLPHYMDPVMQAYPYHNFLWRSLQRWQFPMWNPHQFSGTPFAANPQVGVFYPPRLLLMALLSSEASFTWLLALHGLLAAVGCYLWVRLLGAGRLGGLLGAAVFTLGGQMVFSLLLPPVWPATAWLPLAFYFIERAARRRRPRWMAAAGAALAMTVLAGYPRTYVFGLMWAVLYTIVRLWPLALPPAGPGLSPRRRRLSWVCGLLSMLCGVAFFSWLAAGGVSHWVYGLEIRLLDPENQLACAFGFGLLAVWLRAGRPLLSQRRLGLLVASLALLIGITATLPMVQLLPGRGFAQLSTHGDPDRAPPVRGAQLRDPDWHHDVWLGHRLAVDESVFVGVLPLLLVAGVVFLPGRYRSQVRLLALLGATALVVGGGRPPAPQLWELIPTLRIFPKLHGALVFVQLAAAGLAALGLERLHRRLSNGTRPGVGLGSVLAGAVLLAACLQLILTGPARIDYRSVEDIYRRAERPASRLQVAVGGGRFQSSDDHIFSTTFDNGYSKLLLVPNLATLFGLNDVAGYDPLQLDAYKKFIAVAEGQGPIRYPGRDRYHHVLPHATGRSPLMDLLSVERRLRRGQHRRFLLRRNKAAFPRAWLVSEAAIAPDPDLAMRWVHEGLLNPRQVVVLDSEDPNLVSAGLGSKEVPAAALSVFGCDWSVARYAGVSRDGVRWPAAGEGLHLMVLEPAPSGPPVQYVVRAGDDEKLSRTIEQLERDWPADTPVALFSAGGFAIGHEPSSTDVLGRLGVDREVYELLEDSTLPLAVAGLGRVGAQPGEARVAVGIQVARVDESAVEPSIFSLGSGAGLPTQTGVKLDWRRHPNRLTGEANSSSGGVLVLSEVGGPGWSASLDGGPKLPLLRAYGLLPALRLPPGRHRFELSYTAPGLGAGALLSLLGLAGLLLIALKGRRRR